MSDLSPVVLYEVQLTSPQNVGLVGPTNSRFGVSLAIDAIANTRIGCR
jgi:hypothetical protein